MVTLVKSDSSTGWTVDRMLGSAVARLKSSLFGAGPSQEPNAETKREYYAERGCGPGGRGSSPVRPPLRAAYAYFARR